MIESKRNDTSKSEEEYPGWWWMDEKAAKGEAVAADVLWQVGIRGLARVDNRTVRAILWTLVALHPSLNSGIMTEWAMVMQEWSDSEHIDTLRAAAAAAAAVPAVASITPKDKSARAGAGAGAGAGVRASEKNPLGDILVKLDGSTSQQSLDKGQGQDGGERQKQKRGRGRRGRGKNDAGATDLPPNDDAATASASATTGTKASNSAGAKNIATQQQQQQQQQHLQQGAAAVATGVPIYRTLVVTDSASDCLRVLSEDVHVVGMLLERMSQVCLFLFFLLFLLLLLLLRPVAPLTPPP
jgi:hypothetical protein